jgi:chorismate mutase
VGFGSGDEEAVMVVRAARGAIVVGQDRPEALLGATQRLLEAMIDRNRASGDDLISVLFRATDDLRSAFPAEAARRMGLGSVPLMCAREIPVSGAMASVIRILMHFHTDLVPSQVQHVYLDGAESLRDDIDH